MKKIIFGDEARKKLLSGAEQICRAVVTTLGPLGNNVAIDKKYGSPQVIHDGVTVAKEVDLEDQFENMGAQMIKEAASKTNEETGDGTTTTTLLTTEIFKSGLKIVSSGENAMLIKKQIDRAVEYVCEEIKKLSKKLDKKDIVKIATLSSQNEEIGKIIAKAFEMVGDDGVIEIENSSGTNIEITHSTGLSFDKGYISQYFANENDEAELENPLILVTTEKLSSIQEIVPLLELIAKEQRSLLIIADDVDGDALAGLVVNKMRGSIRGVAVKAPGFGDRRKEMLLDIAMSTGATLISKETGGRVESITIGNLGTAKKVIVDKNNTIILGSNGDTKQRVESLRNQIKEATSEFDKEKLQERLAKLTDGVAVIKVGAYSEIEQKELLERAKDAVGATRSAIDGGIVEGSGYTMFKIAKQMKVKTFGDKIIKEAIQTPMKQIMKNSGIETLEPINVLTGERGNLIEMGIIDPTKVLISSLNNASSVAGMMITTDCLISPIKETQTNKEL